MELTGLKNILNTGKVTEENLPGYSIGKVFNGIGNSFKKDGFFGKEGGLDKFLGGDNKTFGTNGAAIGTAATGVLDMVNGIGAASTFNRTADDLLRDAGTSLNNIGGVGYTVQNSLDNKLIEQETNAESTSSTLGLTAKGAATGAAIASVIPGVGTAVGGIVGGAIGLVGGLFGAGKKKDAMRKAQRLAEIKKVNTNNFNRSGALTTVLQNDLALTEGNQEDQALYGAANGKPSYSAGGPVDGYNARVSNGEIIANKFTGEMFRVPGIPNNKDGKLALIRPSDTIITNKYGLSDYVAETGDLEGGEAMMSSIMKTKGAKGYKCGKLPKYVNGLPELVNSFVNLGGATLAGLDASRIRNLAISNPNFRLNLQNRSRIDAAMLSRHENPYPIMEQYYNSLAKQKYNLRNTYGLSQAQIAMMDASAEQQSRESMGRLLTEQQRSNNAMIADAARLMAQEDATQAELNFNADKAGYDAYNQAHGEREMMASQRQADMMNFAEQWAKGLADLHMWRRMMNNYEDETAIKKAEQYQKAGLSPWGARLAEKPTDVDAYNFINNIQPTISQQEKLFSDDLTAHKPKQVEQSKEIETPDFGDLIKIHTSRMTAAQKRQFYKKNPQYNPKQETPVKKNMNIDLSKINIPNSILDMLPKSNYSSIPTLPTVQPYKSIKSGGSEYSYTPGVFSHNVGSILVNPNSSRNYDSDYLTRLNWWRNNG